MANFYYKFSPYLRLGAGYEVFLNKHPDGNYQPEYRYYPAILIPYQKKLFSGSFRSYLMNTFTRWGVPHWEWRNRVKVSCQLMRAGLKSFLVVEPYHKLGAVEDYRFNKIRYLAGFTFGFADHYQLDVYYLREDYQHRALRNNIVAIDYSFSF